MSTPIFQMLEARQIKMQKGILEIMELNFQNELNSVEKTADEGEKLMEAKRKKGKEERKKYKKLMEKKMNNLDALFKKEKEQHERELLEYELKKKISELKNKKLEEELAELEAAKLTNNGAGSTASS